MAMDMQRSIQALATDWRARGHAIGFGAGAAMGPATVGRIGTENRVEYTAIGSVVNLAQRLESNAGADGILISARTSEFVRSEIPLEAAGPMRLKGIRDPVEVFRVLQRFEPAPEADVG